MIFVTLCFLWSAVVVVTAITSVDLKEGRDVPYGPNFSKSLLLNAMSAPSHGSHPGAYRLHNGAIEVDLPELEYDMLMDTAVSRSTVGLSSDSYYGASSCVFTYTVLKNDDVVSQLQGVLGHDVADKRQTEAEAADSQRSEEKADEKESTTTDRKRQETPNHPRTNYLSSHPVQLRVPAGSSQLIVAADVGSYCDFNRHVQFFRLNAWTDDVVYVGDLNDVRATTTPAQEVLPRGGSMFFSQSGHLYFEFDHLFNFATLISGVNTPVLELSFYKSADDSADIYFYHCPVGVTCTAAANYTDNFAYAYLDYDDLDEGSLQMLVPVEQALVRIETDDVVASPYFKIYKAGEALTNASVLADISSATVEDGCRIVSETYSDDDIYYEFYPPLSNHTFFGCRSAGSITFTLPEVVREMRNPIMDFLFFYDDESTIYPWTLSDAEGNIMAHQPFGFNGEDDTGSICKFQFEIGNHVQQSLNFSFTLSNGDDYEGVYFNPYIWIFDAPPQDTDDGEPGSASQLHSILSEFF